MTFYITLAIAAFLFSLLGTRIFILAVRDRQLSLPAARRSHHIARTPGGGGIVVVFSLLICLAQVDFYYGAMFAMLMLVAISLLSDMLSIPRASKIIAQVLAVCVPLSAMSIDFLPDFIPPLMGKILIGTLWVWFINLFRFMDGIDGLSSVVTISVAAGICLTLAIAGEFPSPLMTYGLIVAASAAGFIWWNWNPAKIFMGEVGSIPIGFLCFYLLLLAAETGYGYAACILPAYYFCDGTITVLRRLYKRKKIFASHNDHYYQKAVRGGRSHASVARYVMGMNILLVMLAVLSVLNPDAAPMNLATAYATVFILLGFFAHTPHDPDHELL